LPRLTEGSIVSSTSARHRKQPPPSPPSSARRGAASRRRRLPETVSALRNRPARVVAAAVAVLVVLVCAWPAAAHWMARVPSTAWVGQADALGLQLADSLGVLNSDQPEVVSVGVAVGPGYLNPLRAVSGLVPERIDQGVDFAGSGPVYALGDAVITNAEGDSAGWPGGGWITYQLLSGPAAGLMVYLAEDVTPTVQVGQHVTALTVVGDMFDGSEGIETGWAMPSGLSAESQLPEAGGINALGPFPTEVGLNFEELLQTLGVPAASNRDQPANGLLPANYPQSWS
jgi:hypothetical protein